MRLGRWRYGLVALGRPLWWLLYVVIFGAGAAVFTWRDELLPAPMAQHFRLIALAPQWPWYWWALAASAVLFMMLFEGGYRAHRAVALERGAADTKLIAVSEDRPFAFHGGVMMSVLQQRPPSGPITVTRIELTFENHGTRMIHYEVTEIFLSLDGGPRATQELPINRGGHVPAQSTTAYSFDVTGLSIARLPAQIEIGFNIEYDNVPPLRRRIMERRVLYTLRSIAPMHWENVITHEREA